MVTQPRYKFVPFNFDLNSKFFALFLYRKQLRITGLYKTLTPIEAVVLLALAEAADLTGFCNTSIFQIVQDNPVSREDAIEALLSLETRQFVQTVSRGNGNKIYQLLIPVVDREPVTPAKPKQITLTTCVASVNKLKEKNKGNCFWTEETAVSVLAKVTLIKGSYPTIHAKTWDPKTVLISNSLGRIPSTNTIYTLFGSVENLRKEIDLYIERTR